MGLWKFNNNLLKDENFKTKMIQCISDNIEKHSNVNDSRVRWELLKFEIRQLCMKYSKDLRKRKNTNIRDLEKRLIEIERSNFLNKDELPEYHNIKIEMKQIEQEKTQGYILRSKAKWYEEGEKSTKYFLNLVKSSKGNFTLIFIQKQILTIKPMLIAVQTF